MFFFLILKPGGETEKQRSNPKTRRVYRPYREAVDRTEETNRQSCSCRDPLTVSPCMKTTLVDWSQNKASASTKHIAHFIKHTTTVIIYCFFNNGPQATALPF